jgi:hypothetical protein
MNAERNSPTPETSVLLESVSRLTQSEFPQEIKESANEFVAGYQDNKIDFQVSSQIHEIRISEIKKGSATLFIPSGYSNSRGDDKHNIITLETVFDTLMVTRAYSGPSMYEFEKLKENCLLKLKPPDSLKPQFSS